MEERRRLVPAKVWGTTLAILLTGAAGVARAQAADAPPPAAPAAPPAAPAAPPPPPTVVIVPPPAPPPAVATEAKPPTSTEAMPATRPDVLPPIDVGAWLRVGSTFQGATQPKQDQRLAHGQRLRGAPRRRQDHQERRCHAEPERQHHERQPHGFNAAMADGSNPGSGNFAAVEDAIISFDFVDEFHLWAGHLLVPVDRANASGPFFMIPWNYPGFFAVGNGFVGAPAEGPSGRNNGAVIWGDIKGGKFSYFAGVFDNGNVGTQPAVFGEIAPGAPRSGAGLLGQRQLLRRQGHPFVRRGRAGPGDPGAAGRQQDLRRGQRRRALRKEARRRQLLHRRGRLLPLQRGDRRRQRLALRARSLRHARRSASATSSRWFATSGRRSRTAPAPTPGTWMLGCPT